MPYSHFNASNNLPIFSHPTDSIDDERVKSAFALHCQHVYAAKKWQNWIYKGIFFAFGMLFLALSLIIFFKTVNFTGAIFFKNCTLIKHSINLLSIGLSLLSFMISYKIQPKKEAIQALSHKIKRELKHPPKEIQIEFHTIASHLFP